MCGIVAVLGQLTDADPPAGADLVAPLDEAVAALGGDGEVAAAVQQAGEAVSVVDQSLRGVPGVVALLDDDLAAMVSDRVAQLEARIDEIDEALDASRLHVGPEVEKVNAPLVRLKDAAWAVRHDRLRTAAAIRELASGATGRAAVTAYHAIQVALSALDRLEVRGRDSAGVHVLITNHALDVHDGRVRSEIEARSNPLFTSGAVRVLGDRLSFVYKAAAEIGELGDNTAAIRAAIQGDELLRRALTAEKAEVTVVAHTRWASVGIISEANAHPLNSEEDPAGESPYVIGALNGDVDNYAKIISDAGLQIPDDITTDAKVIPTLVARRIAAGAPTAEAFRESVSQFEGSVAIAASAADDADHVMLALRGSGQALYVGLADHAFVVASEPYGIVEQTDRYVRMDGEAPSAADGSPGQIVVLSRQGAGTAAGIARMAYDGTELPIGDDDIRTAEITTRDIDRRGAPHFLLKEITESPESVRKTLRGKLVVDRRGELEVVLPDTSLSSEVRAFLPSVTTVLAIGQGTAAVAGQAFAAVLQDAIGKSPVKVEALPATELSGFRLGDDMSDTLVVAISQSGTTTDTNRTVDLVRGRGARVLSIVNRRNSDLVEKSDGVLYTSDGRDVEMAVPSTKAFYAQVAAGVLLAIGIADAAGWGERSHSRRVLRALRQLPEALDSVLGLREQLATAAHRHAPSRRHWAIVGNGLNRIAAQELRIKLSELCYKSIACDVTEDKKHIDLSAEPLVLVCAAGLRPATAGDVSKEIAIYRAHKALPIVLATEGTSDFDAAVELIELPALDPSLDFVLAAMAGHLFGYEAAVAIDAQARQLRELRAAIEDVMTTSEAADLLDDLRPRLEPGAAQFFSTLRSGAFNGHLELATGVRLASLLRYGAGLAPLEAYELEFGKVASPDAVVEDLVAALSEGIDELTRPIDAIKHQAKTVTVGISRPEETFAEVALVAGTIAAGATRDRIGYRGLRTLAALDPAVESVTGYTRYEIAGDIAAGTATIHVVDRGGIAQEIPTRTDRDPTLRGTKRRAADTKQVWVARGHDGRTLVLVPEVKDNQVSGLTLLHVEFRDRLDSDVARDVLVGYQNRYNALVDAVTETEPAFDDSALGEVPIFELLVVPVADMAVRWRSRSAT